MSGVAVRRWQRHGPRASEGLTGSPVVSVGRLGWRRVRACRAGRVVSAGPDRWAPGGSVGVGGSGGWMVRWWLVRGLHPAIGSASGDRVVEAAWPRPVWVVVDRGPRTGCRVRRQAMACSRSRRGVRRPTLRPPRTHLVHGSSTTRLWDCESGARGRLAAPGHPANQLRGCNRTRPTDRSESRLTPQRMALRGCPDVDTRG